MKLDSDPISISGNSQIESQLELEEIVVQDHSTKEDSILVVFGTTFLTIFLAEMGDKTQLSTLLMSAESHTPWVVFMGSGAALITTSLLSVLLGGWMASKFSPKTVEKSAGLMLLLIAVMLVWDVIKG